MKRALFPPHQHLTSHWNVVKLLIVVLPSNNTLLSVFTFMNIFRFISIAIFIHIFILIYIYVGFNTLLKGKE